MNEFVIEPYKPPIWEMCFDPVTFLEPVMDDLPPVNLSLFTVTRDSGCRIKEWLAFHYIVGVQRFIICLHKCQDDTEAQIKSLPFYDPETIIIHTINNQIDLPQMGVYDNIIKNYAYSTRWALILDDDEFFFSPENDDLNYLLKRYEAYGGVTANWQWFGSNNHVLRPKGLVIEAYTKRARDDYSMHWGCKSIIQPKRWIKSISPHRFETSPCCVNEYFQPVCGHWRNGTPCSVEVLRVNHYKVRSMEDWVQRCRRGDGVLINPPPFDVSRFIAEDKNDVDDFTILKFADRVKNLIQ